MEMHEDPIALCHVVHNAINLRATKFQPSNQPTYLSARLPTYLPTYCLASGTHTAATYYCLWNSKISVRMRQHVATFLEVPW
jgi:hypothetical protein